MGQELFKSGSLDNSYEVGEEISIGLFGTGYSGKTVKFNFLNFKHLFIDYI